MAPTSTPKGDPRLCPADLPQLRGATWHPLRTPPSVSKVSSQQRLKKVHRLQQPGMEHRVRHAHTTSELQINPSALSHSSAWNLIWGLWNWDIGFLFPDDFLWWLLTRRISLLCFSKPFYDSHPLSINYPNHSFTLYSIHSLIQQGL